MAISFLLVFLFVIPLASSLRINEVELNPVGGSSGREWIELYNENSQQIDISGWIVYDGLSSPTKIFTMPNNTILQSNLYYIIELNYSKLNNDGDFVTLYNSLMQQVDQTPKTPPLKDSNPGIKTQQYCSSGYVFAEATKNSENNCPSEENVSVPNPTQEPPAEPQNETNESSSETPPEATSDNSSPEDNSYLAPPQVAPATSPAKVNRIVLNQPKLSASSNSIFSTKDDKFRFGLIVGFMILSVILIILLALKKL
jgi:hypothetical protein